MAVVKFFICHSNKLVKSWVLVLTSREIVLKVTCFFIVWKQWGPIKWGTWRNLWCPHMSHFCDFRTGFDVFFLAVLRSSKVIVLFPFTSILAFSIFGPFLVRAVSRACTLLPSTPLYMRAFAVHRGGIQRRKGPCPQQLSVLHATSQCTGGGLFISIWDLDSGSFSELPWLRVRNTNCRWVVLGAQLPSRRQGQLQWSLGSQLKPPCCV